MDKVVLYVRNNAFFLSLLSWRSAQFTDHSSPKESEDLFTYLKLSCYKLYNLFAPKLKYGHLCIVKIT